MTRYHVDDRVQVFCPELQRLVPGWVITTTVGCVLVALDDRMIPVTVHPADTYRIQPLGIGQPALFGEVAS